MSIHDTLALTASKDFLEMENERLKAVIRVQELEIDRLTKALAEATR